MSYTLTEINEAIFEEYQAMCEEFYSVNTSRAYLKAFHILTKWGEEVLGKHLLQLTKEDAQTFICDLQELKNEDGSYKLKDNTLERRLSAFISIYHFLGEHYQKENIFDGLTINRVPRHELVEKEAFDYLTDQQVEELLMTIKIHAQNNFLALRDTFMVRLLVSTGLTVEEMIHLTLDQVDFKNQQLTLKDGRVLPLSKRLEENYQRYLIEREKYAERKPENDRYVFLSLRGALLSPQNNNATLRKAGRLAGFPFTLSGSNLRHTYAVRQLNGNVPVEVVSKRMGHQRLYYTLRLYSAFIRGDYYEKDLAF